MQLLRDTLADLAEGLSIVAYYAVCTAAVLGVLFVVYLLLATVGTP